MASSSPPHRTAFAPITNLKRVWWCENWDPPEYLPSKHKGFFCWKAICLIFFGPWGSLAHNGVGVLKKWVFMRRNKKIGMAYLLDLVTSREHWLHPFTSSISEVLLVRDLVPENITITFGIHKQKEITHFMTGWDPIGSPTDRGSSSSSSQELWWSLE